MALRAHGGRLDGLALCAGIGGLELGLAAAMPGYATVCYVEREAVCAGILAARMADGRLHDAPIWSDLATFDGAPWRGLVDVVTAGYPCQPFSVAGRRAGAADPRHLWPHVARIIAQVAPAYVFLENVPGHVRLGLQAVRADLFGMGYSVHAGVFSAAQCGAPHLRKRLFIFAAHAERVQLRQQCGRRESRTRAAVAAADGIQKSVANADVRASRQHGAHRCSLGSTSDSVQARRTAGDSGAGTGRREMADTDGERRRWPHHPELSSARNVGAATGREHRHHGPARCCGAGRERNVAHADGARPTHESMGARRRAQADIGAGTALGALGVPADGPTSRLDGAWHDDWEHDEPRTASGQPHRIDQLRALGNAVVPQTAALAFTTLAAEWAATR